MCTCNSALVLVFIGVKFLGVNGMNNAASSYTIWLISSVWRRKTSLLAILIVTLLLLLCVQYNITKEIVEISLSRQQETPEAEENGGGGGNALLKNRVRTVQFIGDEGSLATRDNLVDVVGKNNVGDNVQVLDGDFVRKKTIDVGSRRSVKVDSRDVFLDRHRLRALVANIASLTCVFSIFRYRTCRLTE